MYCLLCQKHNAKNEQNKSETFSNIPSTRFKASTTFDHFNSKKHKDSVEAEMLSRVSCFQKELDLRVELKEVVLEKVFQSVYFLAKENIANMKAPSLIQLMQNTGVGELNHFQHTSPSTYREFFLTLGETVASEILDKARSVGCYGLLIDDLTDCSVMEQMISFIQFFDPVKFEVNTSFLSISNILEDSTSANSETLFKVLCQTLAKKSLPLSKLKGLVTDGAAVMIGNKNGLAAKLREVNPNIISVHCICHRLALSCTDTNASLSYLEEVQLIVTQLWKMLENSPKKMAAFLKCQFHINQILNPDDTVSKSQKLKKACNTRWLSFGNAVSSVFANIPAILQTLRELQKDPTAFGLLKKMNNCKFIGTIYILHDVLPKLSLLSRVFQKGVINYADILPSYQYTLDSLLEIRNNKAPISKFMEDLNSTLNVLELTLSEYDSTYMYLVNLTEQYTSALSENIVKRLGSALPVLSSFAIFNPNNVPSRTENGFGAYGVMEINILFNHFYKDSDQALLQEITAEWQKLKYNLLQWKADIPSDISTNSSDIVQWTILKIMKFIGVSFYPKLGGILEVILATPVSNAWPERGVSKVRLVKNRLRSSLKNDILNALLNISINGPPMYSPEYYNVIKNSVNNWLASKNRRKLPSASANINTCISDTSDSDSDF
ncbi:hypothetical protein SNE40_009783 [Patella caerulea]|uniref:HAT C-terminal dimerisation domain-containing protein n=1 Tax=Patella caerulea TaxID=87958 RepID=A0AAN8JPA0_PATCE